MSILEVTLHFCQILGVCPHPQIISPFPLPSLSYLRIFVLALVKNGFVLQYAGGDTCSSGEVRYIILFHKLQQMLCINNMNIFFRETSITFVCDASRISGLPELVLRSNSSCTGIPLLVLFSK